MIKRVILIRFSSFFMLGMSIVDVQGMLVQESHTQKSLLPDRQSMQDLWRVDRIIHQLIFNYFNFLGKRMEDASSFSDLIEAIEPLNFFEYAVVVLKDPFNCCDRRFRQFELSALRFSECYKSVYPEGLVASGFPGDLVPFSPLSPVIDFLRKLMDKTSTSNCIRIVPYFIFLDDGKKAILKEHLNRFAFVKLPMFIRGLTGKEPRECLGYDDFIKNFKEVIIYLMGDDQIPQHDYLDNVYANFSPAATNDRGNGQGHLENA